MKIHIGMRTIKTALAVTIDVAASYALRLEYPFYAAIASIVVLQIYTRDTVAAGRNRLVGTVLGGLAASVFFLIPVNRAITSGIGILLLFFVMSHIGLRRSIVIAGIVFMRVMVDLEGETPLAFTWNRTIATALGVAVSIAVNLLFFPYHRTQHNAQRFAALRARLLQTAAALFAGQPAELPAVSALLEQTQGDLEKYRVEYRLFSHDGTQAAQMLVAATHYHDALRHMEMLAELPAAPLADAGMRARLAALHPENMQTALPVKNTSPATDPLPAAVPPYEPDAAQETVRAYHAARMLESLEAAQEAVTA